MAELVLHKRFSSWQFKKLEQLLDAQAAQGYALVSATHTGGTPTEGQMRGLLSVTPNARHYLGFDKDDAGRQFVANFRKVAAEMGFRHEHVQAYHPLGCYKDWNDALLNKKSAELIAKGEPDTFDYAEFIAAGKAEKQREKEEKNTYHRSV